jgi:hypothetical protein
MFLFFINVKDLGRGDLNPHDIKIIRT